jgi:hypothetical protein
MVLETWISQLRLCTTIFLRDLATNAHRRVQFQIRGVMLAPCFHTLVTIDLLDRIRKIWLSLVGRKCARENLRRPCLPQDASLWTAWATDLC